MLTLGIETSTRRVSCAVGDGNGVRASTSIGLDQRHTETLVPAIGFLLRSLGLSVADLEAVAVGLGPGLFTGLRVGVATARALAQARRLPLLGLSSLDLVAEAVRVADRPLVVAMDARRGELFWATYEPSPGRSPRRLHDDRVDPPAVVAAAVADLDGALVAGDGAMRYPGAFADLPGVDVVTGELALPSAAVLVELAADRLGAGETTPPGLVVPRYVRPPDADARWLQRPAPPAASCAGGRPAAARREAVS